MHYHPRVSLAHKARPSIRAASSRGTLPLACLCVLLASPAWGQERTKETFRVVAGRMVKAINAADYEGLRKDFNKEMLEAFPVERCRTFVSKEISGKFGEIDKLEPPQFKSAAEAVFVARCERGALDFTLTLDDQGRVAGMLFRPTTAPPIAEVLKQINDGETVKLYAQLNAEFQKAVSLTQFRAVMREVKKLYGKLGRFTEKESKGPSRVYRVEGEKGSCLVTISVDSAGKISGLTITADSSCCHDGVAPAEGIRGRTGAHESNTGLQFNLASLITGLRKVRTDS